MKKNLYEVYIEQEIVTYTTSFFKKGKFEELPHYIPSKNKIILATSENEAIEIYNNRYKVDYNYILDPYFNMTNEYKISSIKNFVKCKNVMYSLNYLKETMRADEFLEYCKQELYGVDECIK